MTESADTERTGPAADKALSWLIPVLLCLESALFVAFAEDRLDLPAYLGWHLGLCAATASIGFLWATASSPPGLGDRTLTVPQLAIWTTLAGPFGAFIAVSLLLPRAAASEEPDAAGGQGPELSRLERLYHSLLDRRLRLDEAHAIRPLLDVMIDGAQSEKFDALSLISKRYVPAVAPALKRALEDRDGSVRVLAATVMARRHNAYTRRIGDLQAIARAAPDAPGGWRDLGRAHLEYAGSGLLEASRVETEQDHANTYLARAGLLIGGGSPELSTDDRLAASHEAPKGARRALFNDEHPESPNAH
jgi:hypothetical protein